MASATFKLDSGEDCWDGIDLIVQNSSSHTSVVRLKDRDAGLEVCRQLAVAYFNGHTGPLSVGIDGRDYPMPYEEWHKALGYFDQWVDDSLLEELLL